MSTATKLSERSCDQFCQVGAVIISDDNTQILALGYNGNHQGGPNERESTDPGESGLIHAEMNALIHLDFNNPKKKIIYITHSPCRMCSKLLINAKISEVVYRTKFREDSGLELLRDSGIIVRQIL